MSSAQMIQKHLNNFGGVPNSLLFPKVTPIRKTKSQVPLQFFFQADEISSSFLGIAT